MVNKIIKFIIYNGNLYFISHWLELVNEILNNVAESALNNEFIIWKKI